MKTETWTIAAMPIDGFAKHMKRVLDEINADHTSTVRDIKYDTVLMGHEVHYSALVILDVDDHTDSETVEFVPMDEFIDSRIDEQVMELRKDLYKGKY